MIKTTFLFLLFSTTFIARGQVQQKHSGNGDNVAGNKIINNNYSFSQGEFEFYEAKRKLAKLELDNALTEIFYCIINMRDFPMEHLLIDNLTISDTAWVAEMDDYGKRVQIKLKELQFNQSILINPGLINSLDQYIKTLYSYNQINYKIVFQDKVTFPFIDMTSAERKNFFNNLNKNSLLFFNSFKNHTKSFPLKKYLIKRLKPII